MRGFRSRGVLIDCLQGAQRLNLAAQINGSHRRLGHRGVRDRCYFECRFAGDLRNDHRDYRSGATNELAVCCLYGGGVTYDRGSASMVL